MNTEINSRQIKLLHIITGLSTGGAEMMLYKILSRLDRERFEPSVISLMDRGTIGDRITSLGIPIHTLDMKPGEIPTPAVIWKLIRTVRDIQPDLTQGWMHQGNLAALAAKFLSKPQAKVFWGIRGTVYSLKLEKKMTAAIIKTCAVLAKFASQVVYVSHIARQQHENLGYPKTNNIVIPNGFETSLFTPSSEARSSLRSELGLKETDLLIGLICRYHPMKDHANFLRAAALLLKSHPEVNFILAGRGVDRDNRSLNDLINKLGIARQIHLLGERRDINRIDAALDIASSASAYGEGFPNVLGEAMSCGVPCVATDVGDSAWIVENTGRIVQPQETEALANAWQELIALGNQGREKLGKAARERIIQYFSLDSVVEQYESLYETALAKN